VELAEQQIVLSLICPDCDLNPRSTALHASMLTITPRLKFILKQFSNYLYQEYTSVFMKLFTSLYCNKNFIFCDFLSLQITKKIIKTNIATNVYVDCDKFDMKPVRYIS
jgi:hypothetical protein